MQLGSRRPSVPGVKETASQTHGFNFFSHGFNFTRFKRYIFGMKRIRAKKRANKLNVLI